jgi:hypothetical protein
MGKDGDGAGETKQRKQGTSLMKAVIQGKSEDWGRRNGDSCKINRKYMYVCIYIYIYIYTYREREREDNL